MKMPLSAMLAFAAFCTFASSAHGATILWNAPVPYTTDGSASDVLNLENSGGTLVVAEYASGSGTQTVNGIPFAEGFTEYAGYNATTAQALNGFTTNNAAYDTVLNGFAYDGSNPNTLTITGLTAGTEYEVQLWGFDNRGGENARTESFSTVSGGQNINGGNLATYDASTIFALGSAVSVTGTFVADGTGDEVIYVNGVGQSQTNLNAFTVQAVPAVVPEPASAMLLGIGGLGLCMMTRRRRTV